MTEPLETETGPRAKSGTCACCGGVLDVRRMLFVSLTNGSATVQRSMPTWRNTQTLVVCSAECAGVAVEEWASRPPAKASKLLRNVKVLAAKVG